MEIEQCLEDFFNEDVPDEKTSIREICIKNPLEKYDFNEDYCILLYEQFKNKHYENFKKCLIIMIKNEKKVNIFNRFKNMILDIIKEIIKNDRDKINENIFELLTLQYAKIINNNYFIYNKSKVLDLNSDLFELFKCAIAEENYNYAYKFLMMTTNYACSYIGEKYNLYIIYVATCLTKHQKSIDFCEDIIKKHKNYSYYVIKEYIHVYENSVIASKTDINLFLIKFMRIAIDENHDVDTGIICTNDDEVNHSVLDYITIFSTELIELFFEYCKKHHKKILYDANNILFHIINDENNANAVQKLYIVYDNLKKISGTDVINEFDFLEYCDFRNIHKIHNIFNACVDILTKDGKKLELSDKTIRMTVRFMRWYNFWTTGNDIRLAMLQDMFKYYSKICDRLFVDKLIHEYISSIKESMRNENTQYLEIHKLIKENFSNFL